MVSESPPLVFHPEILVLCCQQALAGDAALESPYQSARGFRATQRLVPCTGKIEVHHLLRYLEQGIDAIEIVSCPDSECQFLSGNARVEKRVERARRLLAQVGMDPERIGLDHGSGLTATQVSELLEARVEAIRPLGSNPMKRERVV